MSALSDARDVLVGEIVQLTITIIIISLYLRQAGRVFAYVFLSDTVGRNTGDQSIRLWSYKPNLDPDP